MIFYGSAAQHFKIDGKPIQTTTFSDGEMSVFLDKNIDNKDITYVQSTAKPVHDNLLELLITLNAFRQKFARRITAVIPYFGYARQDRLGPGASAISAKVVADLIGHSGIDKLVVFDLHTPQLTGFFPMPVLHLSAIPLFTDYFKKHFAQNESVIVSPDIGGLKRANDLADHVSAHVAVINKKRLSPGVTEAGEIVGNVVDKRCILIDDMIDSGNTIINAANKLLENGAREVHCMATHGVFSKSAIADLEASAIQSICITNTILHTKLSEKFKLIDVWPSIKEQL